MELKNSPAAKVFEFFKEMNQIPRGSGNEKAVSDWLVKFAKDRNLEVEQDDSLNVIIRKPGTEGYENSDMVILQGHMDMVNEKADDSNHDFTKDPIAFIVDGDYIHADNTTLGADNGIAVAMSLEILDSDKIPHPPLEVLVTTAEETGMYGAAGLKKESIKGRTLINIDSEEENKILVSCSGGQGNVIHLPIAFEEAANREFYTVKVDGLFGGHSGMEINKQRGNATHLLSRVLLKLMKEADLRLVNINGGSKHNAIPRLAQATIAINAKDEKALESSVNTFKEIFKKELAGVDDKVNVSFEKADKAEKIMDADTTKKVLTIIKLIPIGVLNMSMDIEGLVQTSNNLGVVITNDKEVTFESAVRSSVRTLRDEVSESIKLIADLTGATIEFDPGYPAWEYRKDSPLREVFIEAHKEQYGKEPEITAIHAGLETGLFAEKFDNALDMVSFGPNLFDVHTPKEKMEIGSVERSRELLLNVLKRLK